MTDRYTTSNMVHQASKLGGEELNVYLDWLYDLEFNKIGLPKPDGVFFLDVSPEVSKKLMEGRANKFTGDSEKDIHESDSEYLSNCYRTSKDLTLRYNWDVINCVSNSSMRSIDDIHNDIYLALKSKM